MENRNDTMVQIKKISISLLGGYLITLAGILILALFLLIFQMTEDMTNIGVIVIYALSSFGAGFLAGKQLKTKKFLWGMLTGGIYYLFLILISAAYGQSLTDQVQDLVTVFLLCFGGASLGGMVS